MKGMDPSFSGSLNSISRNNNILWNPVNERKENLLYHDISPGEILGNICIHSEQPKRQRNFDIGPLVSL